MILIYFNRTIEGVRFINLLNDGKETLNAVDLENLSSTMNTFVFDVLGLEAETTDIKLEAVVNMLIE
jgi:cysteinyl-tRNA synthetase